VYGISRSEEANGIQSGAAVQAAECGANGPSAEAALGDRRVQEAGDIFGARDHGHSGGARPAKPSPAHGEHQYRTQPDAEPERGLRFPGSASGARSRSSDKQTKRPASQLQGNLQGHATDVCVGPHHQTNLAKKIFLSDQYCIVH